uniref:ARAD1C25762p n=1 Tax=Blastobotrys adeninivorans TaxID=409370 RepID=A0A060T227_BLAAD
MTTLIRYGLPPPPESEASSTSVCDNCDYYDNYVEIMYKQPEQFKLDLQQELAERSGLQLLDLVVVVPEAKESIGKITNIFKELRIEGEGYLCIDGSYKFVMQNAFHGRICSKILLMLLNKITARSLVEQELPPKLKLNINPVSAHVLAQMVGIHHDGNKIEGPSFKRPDGGLSDIFLPLLSSLTGDSYYPPLILETGVSQRTPDLICASLLHATSQGIPLNTILTADVKIGRLHDEIVISQFDLHHFDFSVENLRHMLQSLPDNDHSDTIQKRLSLKWAIYTKLSRAIARLWCLQILVEETTPLYQSLDREVSPEELIEARDRAIIQIRERIDTILPDRDFSWDTRALFTDKSLKAWQHLDRELHLLGGRETLISQIEQTRQYYEAELRDIAFPQNINSEDAILKVIALVLDSHETYQLHDPANLRQGFRIPVASILNLPTEQEWIEVTITDLQGLFNAADLYVEQVEGSITNMIVHRNGVKRQYRQQFFELARGDSNIQTFDELFGENDSIDTKTCVRFVSTGNIRSYLESQGVEVQQNASRVNAVSKLLDIFSEANEIDFLLHSSTMEYFHAHRRSDAAMHIMASLGQTWGQDPWASLQEFVSRQGSMNVRLPLKYFTNDGLIRLHWIRGLIECPSGRRENLVRTLAFQATSWSPDPQGGEEEEMEHFPWIDDLMTSTPLLDRLFTRELLTPTRVVELLRGVTDPELQRRITDAAFADPGSFAVVLQTSSDLEEFLTLLNLP